MAVTPASSLGTLRPISSGTRDLCMCTLFKWAVIHPAFVNSCISLSRLCSHRSNDSFPQDLSDPLNKAKFVELEIQIFLIFVPLSPPMVALLTQEKTLVLAHLSLDYLESLGFPAPYGVNLLPFELLRYPVMWVVKFHGTEGQGKHPRQAEKVRWVKKVNVKLQEG